MLYFFKYAYSSLLKSKNFIIKIPKDSRFLFLVLNAVFIIVYHVKAVQDDIWLYHTVSTNIYLYGNHKHANTTTTEASILIT